MSVAVCLEEERGRHVYEGEEGVLYPAEHWDQPAFLSQEFVCLFVCGDMFWLCPPLPGAE